MPFRITMRSADVQEALTSQGYTAGRAGGLDKLDDNVSSRAAPGDILANPANKVDGAKLDANISSRAAIGDAMDLNSGAEGKVKTQAGGAMDDRGFTSPRGAKLDNLDTAISSRAAPGSAMELVSAARAAIWNELVPGTPASGSFGEKLKSNLDASISTRAQSGDAMDLNAGAETKVKSQAGGAMDDRGFNSARGANLDRLDESVSTRATPTDVDTKLGDRGVNTTRMAKLDSVSAPASASDSVAAGGNTSGLTVELDTGYRTVVEMRYSCGGPADLYIEGSDDGSTWYEGDSFSEGGAVTDKIVGYLSARKYIRIRSLTTGVDLSFELVALL